MEGKGGGLEGGGDGGREGEERRGEGKRGGEEVRLWKGEGDTSWQC